ncbi:hypothetical protein [Mesoplasma photuris]|uniref:hypothetical protein n=1 Tax=Mesoplasma photuris TaxID=217731 RepID=UPI0004E16FC6|nr:hypothetical protein [Mesoplasma photuris]
MSEYEKIALEFKNNSISKINYADFKKYKIKWKFDGFENIVSKPIFLTYLQTNFDFQFSIDMINKIEEEIDEMRHIFKLTSEGAQTYLNEIGIPEIIIKNYNRFLLTAYTDLRNFINQALIPWVFYQELREDWSEGKVKFDTNKYYEYKFQKLKYDFQNNLKKVLKSISKIMPNDQTLNLMLSTYDDDMAIKEHNIYQLKLASKKED